MGLLWTLPVVLLLIFFVAACLRAGWRLGRRRMSLEGTDSNEGLGSIDAAIFGLMGLLIAFTFTGAASRFEHRRDLIVQEVNAIGTAWLRLDLLADEPRREVRELFRQYLDQRLAVYRKVTDAEAVATAQRRLTEIQSQIWGRLIAAAHEDRVMPIAQTVLPPVNDMFDIAQTRVLATEMHPPPVIYVMLGILVLVSAFLAGFGQAKASRQSLLHLAGFAATTAIAIYLILDLEYPRLGLIRVDDFDRTLVELRESMQ